MSFINLQYYLELKIFAVKYTRRKIMSIEVFVEQAFNGECIWLRYGNDIKFNIIIDSGPGIFAKGFKKLIDKIVNNNEVIDLLILTHIDDDHINGFRKSISSIDGKYIKQVWINGNPEHYYNNQPHSPKNIGSLVDAIKNKNINLDLTRNKPYIYK